MGSMTAEQVRRQMASYTYRPRWTFELIEGHCEGLQTRMVGPVEDSYHPGRTIDLGINDWLPPLATPDDLDRWMAYRCQRIEIHESREWLRRNGVLVNDPHA